MKQIEKLIEQRYANHEELISLIKEFSLIEIVKASVSRIETKMKNGKLNDLPILSGLILNDINVLLSKVTDKEKKRKIEYLLADIFQDFLIEISKSKDSEKIITEIELNIKETCEYRGYDYKEFSSILDIKKNLILLPKPLKSDIYYHWNGRIEELDEFASDISSSKIILSVKEFKRMFKPIKGNLTVRFNIEKYDSILILFQVLKEVCLITPKGISGHFAPLVRYAVDKDGEFLIKNSANKEHARIKRNSAVYNELKAKMMKIVKSNARNSIGQLLDNDHSIKLSNKR